MPCSTTDSESTKSVGVWSSRGTVRRFARAATVEELLAGNGTGRRLSLLEEFKPYLRERWSAGCTNATTLFTEITARGYRGGPTLVRDYLHQFRTATHIPHPPRKPPSVRRVVGWMMSDPAALDPLDQTRLDAVLAASPPLTALVSYVRAFASMMCSLRGQNLEHWMKAIEADDRPALRSFVKGLRRDQDAVTAGLTLPWSSGVVEGNVNRLKMLKRQMFGRANPTSSANASQHSDGHRHTRPAAMTSTPTRPSVGEHRWREHSKARSSPPIFPPSNDETPNR